MKTKLARLTIISLFAFSTIGYTQKKVLFGNVETSLATANAFRLIEETLAKG